MRNALWKAERARFLDKMERRAKPETERTLPRWGKEACFRFTLPDPCFLISITEKNASMISFCLAFRARVEIYN